MPDTGMAEVSLETVYEAMLCRIAREAAEHEAEVATPTPDPRAHPEEVLPNMGGDFMWRTLYRPEGLEPEPVRAEPAPAIEPDYPEPQPACPAPRPRRTSLWRDVMRYDDPFAVHRKSKPRKKFTERQIAEIANLIRGALVPPRVGDKFAMQRVCFFNVVEQFTDYFYGANNGNFDANTFADQCGRKLIDKLYERIHNPSPLVREEPLP